MGKLVGGKMIDDTPIDRASYFDTCATLDTIIDTISLFACKRCNPRPHTSFHHPGKWMQIVQPEKKISVDTFQQWVDDAEHGLFHGFSTFIAAALTVPHLITCRTTVDILGNGLCNFERMIVACLLHDFGRFLDSDNHDGVMREYFPKIQPAVFTHSDPPNELDHLVVGDRAELRRFKDFDTWRYDHINIPDNRLIKKYYTMIRPVLQYTFVNRYNECLRHGTERDVIYPFNRGIYPLPRFSKPFDSKACPIDVGTPTSHLFIRHGCIWGVRYGIISIEDAKKAGVEFFNLEREHLYMQGSAPLSEWYFVHHGLCYRDKFVCSAVDSQQNICPADLIGKMLRTLNLIQCLLKALMCEI